MKAEISKILLEVLAGKITPDEAHKKLVNLTVEHMENAWCGATGIHEDHFENWLKSMYPELSDVRCPLKYVKDDQEDLFAKFVIKHNHKEIWEKYVNNMTEYKPMLTILNNFLINNKLVPQWIAYVKDNT
jgi:hypothetical protein